MAELTTFIKLDRNILDWGWYKDCNTVRVFIHLLLVANVSEGKFQELTIRRGQHITSQDNLANELGLTRQQVRTALKHLEETGEVKLHTFNRFTLITINNYSKYQNKAKPEKPAEKPKGTGYIPKEAPVKKEKAEKVDKFTDEEGYEYTLINGEYEITKRPQK